VPARGKWRSPVEAGAAVHNHAVKTETVTGDVQ